MSERAREILIEAATKRGAVVRFELTIESVPKRRKNKDGSVTTGALPPEPAPPPWTPPPIPTFEEYLEMHKDGKVR